MPNLLGEQVARIRNSSPRRVARKTAVPIIASQVGIDGVTSRLNDALNQCELKALKEWSLTLEALNTGRQQILLRKGGIRESTFVPAATCFLLFPTGFHTDTGLLKPDTARVYWESESWDPKSAQHIPIKSVAQVCSAYTTADASVLHVLDAFHIWGEGFAQKRLRWRAEQPITAMLLRVWKFEEPLLIAQSDELWGCFSWVELSERLSSPLPALAEPAIPDDQWIQIQGTFKLAMKQLGATPLQLPGHTE